MGNHSFNVPYYMLVLQLNRVQRLAVMIMYCPAFRVGSHSFNVPYYITCIYAEPGPAFGVLASYSQVGPGQM